MVRIQVYWNVALYRLALVSDVSKGSVSPKRREVLTQGPVIKFDEKIF